MDGYLIQTTDTQVDHDHKLNYFWNNMCHLDKNKGEMKGFIFLSVVLIFYIYISFKLSSSTFTQIDRFYCHCTFLLNEI